MKHATTVAVYEYWRDLRGLRRAASRAAIDPASLGPLLPDLFLIETDATRDAQFRFCGASIARRYGRDLEGESFLDWWSGEDRVAMRRNLSLIGRDLAPIVLGTIAETAGGGATTFEMILLPLLGDSGCDGAIGSLARTGGHDEINRIRARILSQEIRSQRFLDGDDGRRNVRRPHVMVPAAQSPARRRMDPPAPSILRSRPRHLTLVVGGKAMERLP